MDVQTLIVIGAVLGAATYVLRLFWRAVRGTRAGSGDAGGCATGGCGCGPAATGSEPTGVGRTAR